MASVDFLPKESVYVVLVLGFNALLIHWMSLEVAKLINSNQERRYQESLGLMPWFTIFLLLGGLQHPLISTGLGIMYVVAFYFYFSGDSTGDPKNDTNIWGLINFGMGIGLMICTVSLGINRLILPFLPSFSLSFSICVNFLWSIFSFEYVYVVLVLGFNALLIHWMSLQVAKLINSNQERRYQESLELMPWFTIFLLLGGLQHPLISTGLGVMYVVAFYFYFSGDSTGDPKNDTNSWEIFAMWMGIGLMICTVSLGINRLILPFLPSFSLSFPICVNFSWSVFSFEIGGFGISFGKVEVNLEKSLSS